MNDNRQNDEIIPFRTSEEYLNRTVDQVKRENEIAARTMTKARNHLIAQFIVSCGLAVVFHLGGLDLLAVTFVVCSLLWVGVFVYAKEKIDRDATESLERAERLERERAEEARIFEETKGVNFDADINISVGAKEED